MSDERNRPVSVVDYSVTVAASSLLLNRMRRNEHRCSYKCTVRILVPAVVDRAIRIVSIGHRRTKRCTLSSLLLNRMRRNEPLFIVLN